MLDRNDLRYVQAIARAESLAEAARQLSVHQSTVFRRLNALEQQLGVRLFERFPTGYVTTAAGEEFCKAAEHIEEDIAALERQINGQDMRPTGTLRVTTTDSLLFNLLTPCFAAFRTAHPEIELEVIVSSQTFDLTKRDADVAIRTTKHPLETLVGRRVAKVATAIYGSKNYLAAHPHLKNLSAHHWVGPDESIGELVSIRWLKRSYPGISFPYRVNTCLGMLAAVKKDLGLAVLQCYIADPEPDLCRVHFPIPELEKDLWVLTHDDLRHVERVRTFVDFIASALAPQRELLEGRKG